MSYYCVKVSRGDNIVYTHSYYTETSKSQFTPHTHDKCEIICLVRGDMKYSAEGRIFKLRPGDIIITRPGLIHSLIPETDSIYERHQAILDEKMLPKSLWEKVTSGSGVFRGAENGLAEAWFSKIETYYKGFEGDELNQLMFNLFQEIVYIASLLSDSSGIPNINPLVESATAYIKNNISTIKNIEEISSALYITKSHLHHVFQREMQITPGKYLISKRLLLAQKLIRGGGKPTEIFSDCGFEDYTTFFRNYKSFFGYPPSSEGKVQVKQVIET